MRLTDEEVRHVAALARVAMTDDEVELMRSQLSNILDHVDVLNQVDTEGVEPTGHSVDVTSVMRDDEVGVRNKAARRFDVDAPALEVVVGQSGGVAASTAPWRWTGAHSEGGGRSATALPPLRTATNRAVSSPSSVRSDSRVGASRARSLPSM